MTFKQTSYGQFVFLKQYLIIFLWLLVNQKCVKPSFKRIHVIPSKTQLYTVHKMLGTLYFAKKWQNLKIVQKLNSA